MILSGASRRGPKRAILGPGGLHGRRHFIFLPYFHRHSLGHLIKSRRKGFPEDPFQFLFSTSRRNEEDQRRRDSPTEREKKLWGMRWEYQERNGVSSERRSEYIQGKGWVDIDSIHPELENQRSVDSSKQPREEFEIDLITLRRVPKGNPTEQPPQNPSTRQENPKSSFPRSHGLGHLGGSGSSTADTNLQRLPSKPLSANEEYPTSPLPGTLNGFRAGAGKSAQDTVSGPNGVPSKPLRAPLTTEASREARDPEATGLREKNPGNGSRAIPLKDSATSTPGGNRNTSDSTPQGQKPAPGHITPPPLPSKPVKPSGGTAKTPLDTHISVPRAAGGTNSSPVPTPRGVSFDPAVSSGAPVRAVGGQTSRELPAKTAEPLDMRINDSKHYAVDTKKTLTSAPRPLPAAETCNINTPVEPIVDKISQELPAKSANLLNTTLNNPPKHQAANTEKILKSAPKPLPVSAETYASTATSGPVGAVPIVENVDSIPQPTRPEVVAVPATVVDATSRDWRADAARALEEGVKSSSPAEVTDHGTIADSTTPSDTAVSRPNPSIPAEPATSGSAGVDVETRAADLPRKLNETLPLLSPNPVEPYNTTLKATPPGLVDSVSDPGTKTVTKGALKEPSDVTPPLSSKPSVDEQLVAEPLKHHRLNVSSKPGSALDSPDADLDLLRSSDIRAAAGAPGKTILKIEGGTEKVQRRAKMLADFEAAEEQRKSSEGTESLEAIKERVRKLSEMGQAHAGKPTETPRDNNMERYTDNTSRIPALDENTCAKAAENPLGEERDYAWLGIEDISTKDVFGTINPTQPHESPQLVDDQATSKVNTTPIQVPTAPPAHKYFILIRDSESDHIQFSTLPSGVVSDTMIRENTAFDSLQSLDFPERFLPLWRVLQKGGFTVVGGEKDCLVVKVEATVAREKQELVMREIKLKLSPAEAVAREGWERKRGLYQPEAEKKFDTIEDGSEQIQDNAGTVATVGTSAPQPAIMPGKIIRSHNPESEPAALHEKPEEVPAKEESPKESTLNAQPTKPKKRRPFRRVFWTAVWVAACSGAVSVGLEEYI